MIAQSGIKDKFIAIQPFRKEFFGLIKKEIAQERLSKGSHIGRKLQALHISHKGDSFVEAFFDEVMSRENEEMGDWLLSSWVVKQADLFQYFHQKLSSLTPDYEQLTAIPADLEKEMKEDALAEFSSIEVYLFAVLNSVVFSKELMQELKQLASSELEEKERKSVPAFSQEELEASFTLEKQRMQEKQERRMQGMAERHKKEIEGYRKQITKLQKKIEEMGG